MNEERLERFELDCHDTADAALEVPTRAFLRRLGLGHVWDELLAPMLAERSALVAVAVRPRPWPPWGVGARTVSALALATAVDGRSAALAGVLAAPQEATSIGLLAAVHRTLLDGLAERGVERVHHVVREQAPFAERLLAGAGFAPSAGGVVVTDTARYRLHEAELGAHREALGTAAANVDELLTDEALAGPAFDRTALYLLGVARALDPWWRELVDGGELIANTGPGRVAECLPPGGTRAIEEVVRPA